MRKKTISYQIQPREVYVTFMTAFSPFLKTRHPRAKFFSRFALGFFFAIGNSSLPCRSSQRSLGYYCTFTLFQKACLPMVRILSSDSNKYTHTHTHEAWGSTLRVWWHIHFLKKILLLHDPRISKYAQDSNICWCFTPEISEMQTFLIIHRYIFSVVDALKEGCFIMF